MCICIALYVIINFDLSDSPSDAEPVASRDQQ